MVPDEALPLYLQHQMIFAKQAFGSAYCWQPLKPHVIKALHQFVDARPMPGSAAHGSKLLEALQAGQVLQRQSANHLERLQAQLEAPRRGFWQRLFGRSSTSDGE